jgi:LysM repeat protein
MVDGGGIYKVKSGDTLSKIAAEHHTTVKAIQSANNLTDSRIKVGQPLKLPVKAAPVTPAP